MAWEVAGPIEPAVGPPSRWPLESNQGPRGIETCIHPGVGSAGSARKGGAGAEEPISLTSRSYTVISGLRDTGGESQRQV